MKDIDAFLLIFVTHWQARTGGWRGIGEAWEREYLPFDDDIRISLLNGTHVDGDAVLLRTGSTIAIWMGAMCPLTWVLSRTYKSIGRMLYSRVLRFLL